MGLFDFLRRKPASEDALSVHTLADIARGMQHAVNSASELADQQFLRLFELYCEKTDDGKAKAKTMAFVYPDGSEVSVPILSLIPPRGLNLERMRVKMAVQVSKTEVKRATKDGALDHVTRTSFQCTFSPRHGEDRAQNVMDVEMTFVAGDPPEGVARVLEGYINAAVPKKPPALPPAAPPESAP